jgi:Uma2 family endonuclease
MSTATLPTPTPATPIMTGAEFLAQYGDESGVELVKGHLVRLPMPGGMHGEVCGNAYSILREFVRPRGLGRLMTNDTYVRTANDPDSYRGADVCFLSYSRLPKDQETPKGPIPAPDLVIEVKSPTDRVNRLSAKATEYLDAGVTAVVVLLPETRVAAVFRNDDVPLRLVGDNVLELPDILPGFTVPVSAFFE